MAFFSTWFAEAQTSKAIEVNAMTLATVDATGQPHARIVLLKGIEDETFVFYTNYHSHKGEEIAANSKVSLVFFWRELERQVRIEGTAQKVAPETSDEYFHSRPIGSQLGAWSSPQSQVIPDRSVLEVNYLKFEKEFGTEYVPRPEHWGGYAITPHLIEFWQGRSNRMHDRVLFTKDGTSWQKSRLAP